MAIIRLNEIISFHAHAYNKSQSAMVCLGANEQTLLAFQCLNCADIRSSTALLNPNMLGSSKLQLSWIWQGGSVARSEMPEELKECEFNVMLIHMLWHLKLYICSPTCTLAKGPGTEVSLG